MLLEQIADPSALNWKDETYDLALARDVSGEERTTLVAHLVAAARNDDPRAVLTLGYIGASETLPALLFLAKTANPMARTARRAVVLLGHGRDVIEQIVHDAKESSAMMDRVAAVLDLAKVGGDRAVDALLLALDDSAYEVRELAWEGLVVELGIDKRMRSPDGKRELLTFVELLSVWIGSKLSTLRRMGVDSMRALVADIRRGVQPVGVDWIANPAPETFAALRRALFDLDAAYPVDEIDRLAGFPRHWAETILLLRLESEDVRVPAALAQLRAEWVVPTLEEVAQTASGALRTALDESIAALKAS